jgi:hypothetical protein
MPTESTPPKISNFEKRNEKEGILESEEPKYDENVILRSKKKETPEKGSPKKDFSSPPKGELIIDEEIKKFNREENRPTRRMERNNKPVTSSRLKQSK